MAISEKKPFRYPYYTTPELVRAATAPKISTSERIAMQDEIARRETEDASHPATDCRDYDWRNG